MCVINCLSEKCFPRKDAAAVRGATRRGATPRPRLTNKSHKRQILVPEAQVNAKVRRITVGAATAERIETIERFQQARPPPATFGAIFPRRKATVAFRFDLM